MSEASSVTEGRKKVGRLSLKKSDGTYRDRTINKSLLIGRGKECDIRIKVKTVSRRHCQVLMNNGDYYLENIGTTNFTSVNHEEVSKHIKLQNGDIITVAERDFLFQLVVADTVTQSGDNASEDAPGLYAIWCGAPAMEDGDDQAKGRGCIIA